MIDILPYLKSPSEKTFVKLNKTISSTQDIQQAVEIISERLNSMPIFKYHLALLFLQIDRLIEAQVLLDNYLEKDFLAEAELSNFHIVICKRNNLVLSYKILGYIKAHITKYPQNFVNREYLRNAIAFNNLGYISNNLDLMLGQINSIHDAYLVVQAAQMTNNAYVLCQILTSKYGTLLEHRYITKAYKPFLQNVLLEHLSKLILNLQKYEIEINER
jgi:hypothetical protein